MENRIIKILLVTSSLLLLASSIFITVLLMNRENEEDTWTPFSDEEKEILYEHLMGRNREDYEDYLNDGRRLSFTFPDGDTPLEKLIYNNDFSGAEQIIETGFDLNLIEDVHPIDTITNIIAYNEYLKFDVVDEITEQLIEQVKDKIEEPDQYGYSLLINAVIANNPLVVDAIIEHVETINRPYNGHTALSFAAYKGSETEILRSLVEQGADINFKSDNGNTVLMHAIVALKIENIRFLLEQPDLELNLVNEEGQTALHVAVNLSDVEIVELLLETSIDRSIKDHNGQTAYDLAQIIHQEYNDEDTEAILALFE